MTGLIHRPLAACANPLRCALCLKNSSLNDTVLPVFVEEELDDYKAIDAMYPA